MWIVVDLKRIFSFIRNARRGLTAISAVAAMACAIATCDPVPGDRIPENPTRGACPVAPAPVTNPEALFRRAFEGQSSTSPLYVLITLVSPDGRSERSVAVTVNLLRGAIDYECSSGCNGMQLARETRRFRFLNPRARQNVEPRYNEIHLRRVRATLGKLSADEFRREALVEGRVGPTVGGVAPFQGSFYSIYALPLAPMERIAMKDATAHVLLECGYLPGIQDISGALYVSAAAE